MLTLKQIGPKCKQYRESIGYKQTDVALDLGYSVNNISSFENGRNDNAQILLWYFAHGMLYEDFFDNFVRD